MIGLTRGLLAASAACLGLVAGAAPAGEDAPRLEIKLEHKGDVFGQGGDWDKQYAREALQIFKDLKPDPAWVAKLQALPDNTWMRAKAAGEQEPEDGRSEVPIVYAPEIRAFLFCCGCTSPGYSSDTWVYHTGANRWVQMWPNFIKGAAGAKPENNPNPGGPWIYDFAKKSWQDMKTPGGPNPAGQGLPLCYDSEHNVVFMRGGWFYRYRRAAK